MPPPTTPPPAGGSGDGGSGGGDAGGGGGNGGGPTVTGGIAIAPGQSIQSAVNANPAGTTFIIKAGVHRRQSIKPKSGNKFIGESGAVLDGENATPQAIVGHGASGVTVRGLRITNYAPPNLGGALDGVESNGWTVENNEIDHNSNGSARTYGLFVGSDWTVRNNKVHHNGWIGITGWECTGTLIDDNEVYANPATIFTDNVGDTGNMKFYGCGDMVVRNNYVHDSPRFGIWFDRSRPGVTIENNRVVNHGEAGIWHEVSYRGTHSRQSRRQRRHPQPLQQRLAARRRHPGDEFTGRDGGEQHGDQFAQRHHRAAGGWVSTTGNTATTNCGTSSCRTTPSSCRRVRRVSRRPEGNAVYDSWNNRFSGNTYTASTAAPFQWKGSNLTPAQWKAGPGSADSF